MSCRSAAHLFQVVDRPFPGRRADGSNYRTRRRADPAPSGPPGHAELHAAHRSARCAAHSAIALVGCVEAHRAVGRVPILEATPPPPSMPLPLLVLPLGTKLAVFLSTDQVRWRSSVRRTLAATIPLPALPPRRLAAPKMLAPLLDQAPTLFQIAHDRAGDVALRRRCTGRSSREVSKEPRPQTQRRAARRAGRCAETGRQSAWG